MIRTRNALCFILFTVFSPHLLWAQPQSSPPVWTVQEAVQFALEHNPDALTAQARISAADADIRAARAAFYPQLGVSGEYSRTDNPMYSFGNILNQGVFSSAIDFNDPGVTDNLQAKAMVQYRFYNGGHDQAALDAAGERGQAARLERESIRARLGYGVVQAFYTIVQAEELVQARQSAIEAIGASLNVAQARFQEGSLLKEDLLSLEVQQSRAEEQLIQARHGLNLAQRGFLHLLGLPASEIRLDTIGSSSQDVPTERDSSGRPELAAMAAMVKAQEAEVRQAKAGQMPTADAFGSYQADKGTEVDDGSGTSWMAGVRLNYTLFDGQRTAAASDRARARLSEVKEQQRKLELALNLEVEQATLPLNQEEERLRVTGKMVEAASESARLARLRFKEGVLLASDLIASENRLTDARVSHALATTARRIAIADLRRAVGLAQFNQGN